MNEDPAQVKVVWGELNEYGDGPGWFIFEVDAEDEGYVEVFKERPTLEQLKAICPTYTEEEQS